MSEPTHTPVLLKEVIDLLNLRKGMNVIDCTLGLGGHSAEILKKIGPKGRLMAFDEDEENLEVAKKRLESGIRNQESGVRSQRIDSHKEVQGRDTSAPLRSGRDDKNSQGSGVKCQVSGVGKNIIFIHSNFENLKEQVKKRKFPAPDAILFDLGLSSPHVDLAERGFSFHRDGPLDMRYDQSQEMTAEMIVNRFKEKELADIIYRYGEERRSRVIARKIVEARKKKRLTTTLELAAVIAGAFRGKQKHHPATLTFQALRIYVNRELEVLESALHQAIELVKPKGRIAVISYHSLEDRLVKNIFRYYTKECICPKELPVCQCNFKKKLYLLTKKPIIPSGIEVQANPRSRSAKLRVAERL